MKREVIIKIIGGIAHVTECPADVSVEVRDFDVEGITGVEFHEDEDGDGTYYLQAGA